MVGVMLFAFTALLRETRLCPSLVTPDGRSFVCYFTGFEQFHRVEACA